jgi:hypothetical protein
MPPQGFRRFFCAVGWVSVQVAHHVGKGIDSIHCHITYAYPNPVGFPSTVTLMSVLILSLNHKKRATYRSG